MNETTEHGHHMGKFFYDLIQPKFISAQEDIFPRSASAIRTSLAQILTFVSENYSTIESQIYRELFHLELDKCTNCKYLIYIKLNVYFQVICRETSFFFLWMPWVIIKFATALLTFEKCFFSCRLLDNNEIDHLPPNMFQDTNVSGNM